MKIYSWNILFNNPDLDRAFDFIARSDFDIFCLQEVPENFLKRLHTLDCFINYHIDVERMSGDIVTPIYVVILSRFPIENQGDISFPDYWEKLPLRTRLFIRLMRYFGFTRIRNRGAHFADVRIGEKLVRVFNLHLILAQPRWRLAEFETAMLQRDPALPTIVCGDLNILEARSVTPLNWVLGGRVRDGLSHRRERIAIEERFLAHELTNPLRGNTTHQFSRSQLDHILVSQSFSIQNASVLPDSIGSDHRPILVETS